MRPFNSARGHSPHRLRRGPTFTPTERTAFCGTPGDWHSTKITGVEDATIQMSGFFGDSYDVFTVDARTGEASGQPYDLGE